MYRSPIRSLARRVASAALSTIVLLLLGLVALSQYDLGPVRVYVVRSASMVPALKPGDLVVVDVTENARQGVGIDDVVLFDDPDGRPILHRVIATSSEGLRTKGDANEDPDTWVVEQVDGVQMIRVPLVGYGLQYLQDGLRVIAMALR